MAPQVVHDPREFQDAMEAARADGRRVGLIPTMGALHEGHLSLVDEAGRRGATFRAVTVFVNPLQFAEGEDLDEYPRTLAADVAACESRGVDLVFAPAPDAMYPPGFATTVRVAGLTEVLEGAHRPTHFEGVTTVVAKLFALAGRCVAVFGQKDYQQWKILARLALDLDLPVEVVGHPIVREPDGLALSSRNRYLSPAERTRALSLSRGLFAAHGAFAAGERDADRLREVVRDTLTVDSLDYVALVEPDTLQTLTGKIDRGALLLAAHVGSTRLIDNLVLG